MRGRAWTCCARWGDVVAVGDPLYRVHACFPADFGFASHVVSEDPGYRIGAPEEIPRLEAEF
jgi:thymidine phosphorylase